MDKSRKNLFLMYKLEILNTFLMAWMPITVGVAGLDEQGMGFVLPFLYIPLELFFYWIFWLIFRKFSNKKKKIAIYMSFILDALFLLVNIWEIVELGVVLWLIVSNMIILLLHVLYTIKAMKQFDEACELQNPEEYDKKDLLNSLSKTIDLSIIGFLFIPYVLSQGGLGFIYAFFVPVRIITGLLAFVTTVKEKKSLATFNIVFATINIFFTFELLEIIFGICHLLTVTHYLNKEDDDEDENEGYSSE